MLPAFIGPERSDSIFRETCVPNSTAALYQRICQSMLQSSTLPKEVLSLQFLPLGVIAAECPIAGNEGAIGLDIFAAPDQRNDSIKTVAEGGIIMTGPIPLVQGGFEMVGTIAVFVPTGAGAQPSVPGPAACGCSPAASSSSLAECASSAARDRVLKLGLGSAIPPGMQWWGGVSVLFNFQMLIESSGINQQVPAVEARELRVGRAVLVRSRPPTSDDRVSPYPYFRISSSARTGINAYLDVSSR